MSKIKNTCDSCKKFRKDIRKVGDSIYQCFICRKEKERGRYWFNDCNAYSSYIEYYFE